MSWDAYNRRKNVVRQVAAIADRRRDGVLPWAELGPMTTTCFDGPEDLLLELQMHWRQRLTGHIDARFGTQERDPRSAAVAGWREAAAELPGVRAILDTHDDDPVLSRAREKELAMLANTAGLAPWGDPRAATYGELVRTEARSILIDRQAPTGGTPSWLDRLRSALVA